MGHLKREELFIEEISGFFKAIGRYFKNFGVAFAKGDIWVNALSGYHGCRLLRKKADRQWFDHAHR